jgi:hypothetical protein
VERQAIEIIRTKSVKDAAQKAKELNWLLAFREKCPNCPRSIPDQPKGPAPDFIFSESDLGIEITEYLLGKEKPVRTHADLKVFDEESCRLLSRSMRRIAAIVLRS